MMLDSKDSNVNANYRFGCLRQILIILFYDLASIVFFHDWFVQTNRCVTNSHTNCNAFFYPQTQLETQKLIPIIN